VEKMGTSAAGLLSSGNLKTGEVLTERRSFARSLLQKLPCHTGVGGAVSLGEEFFLDHFKETLNTRQNGCNLCSGPPFGSSKGEVRVRTGEHCGEFTGKILSLEDLTARSPDLFIKEILVERLTINLWFLDHQG
jgi:hypothetical protein